MDTVRNLMQALYMAIGNKRYMHDIEKLFESVDLTPEQQQALRYLAQDLRRLESETHQKKRFF